MWCCLHNLLGSLLVRQHSRTSGVFLTGKPISRSVTQREKVMEDVKLEKHNRRADNLTRQPKTKKLWKVRSGYKESEADRKEGEEERSDVTQYNKMSEGKNAWGESREKEAVLLTCWLTCTHTRSHADAHTRHDDSLSNFKYHFQTQSRLAVWKCPYLSELLVTEQPPPPILPAVELADTLRCGTLLRFT